MGADAPCQCSCKTLQPVPRQVLAAGSTSARPALLAPQDARSAGQHLGCEQQLAGQLGCGLAGVSLRLCLVQPLPEKQLSKPVGSVSTTVDMGQAVYHLPQATLSAGLPVHGAPASACGGLLGWTALGNCKHPQPEQQLQLRKGSAWLAQGVKLGAHRGHTNPAGPPSVRHCSSAARSGATGPAGSAV